MTRTIFYLDQRIWVELVKAKASGDPERNKVYTEFVALAHSPNFVFPLSGAHYMETWHRRSSERSRVDLAGLMRDVSQYVTFAPVSTMRDLEADATLHREFSAHRGFCDCEGLDLPRFVIGRGVAHAFDSPLGRIRIVESLASGGQREGRRVAPSVETSDTFRLANNGHHESYEWLCLSGEDLELPDEGFELYTQHRLGAELVTRELNTRRQIIEKNANKHMVKMAVFNQEMMPLLANLRDVAVRHGYGLPGVMNEIRENWDETYAFQLLERNPVRFLLYHLRWQKHRDLNSKWEQHDSADLAALAVAGVYADIVVTEKRWARALEAANADGRWGTRSISSIEDLLSCLREDSE